MVRDIKKLTLCAEDVEECHIINKTTPAPPVDTQLPEQENVLVFINADGWSLKTQQRKGTGTGRMQYLKHIPRVFKNKMKGLN